jgi:hypothetical protein
LLDRYRKSVKNKRKRREFEATKAEIEELLALKCDEEIELWFYDESGFDLTFSVPSARQTTGTIIEVPSENSQRLNVLGFLSPNNRFESFNFFRSIDSYIIIACFDNFVNRPSAKVVFLDNASTHTSNNFYKTLKYGKARAF